MESRLSTGFEIYLLPLRIKGDIPKYTLLTKFF